MPSTKKTDVVCDGQNGTEEHSRRVEVKSTPEKRESTRRELERGGWDGLGGRAGGWDALEAVLRQI